MGTSVGLGTDRGVGDGLGLNGVALGCLVREGRVVGIGGDIGVGDAVGNDNAWAGEVVSPDVPAAPAHPARSATAARTASGADRPRDRCQSFFVTIASAVATPLGGSVSPVARRGPGGHVSGPRVTAFRVSQILPPRGMAPGRPVRVLDRERLHRKGRPWMTVRRTGCGSNRDPYGIHDARGV